MIHSGLRLLTAVVIANLLAACASTSLIEDQNTLLETDEVIVLTRIKVIYRQCNHCEHRTNPATGKLEIAHSELPAFSIVTAKYSGKLVLSSGGAIKPGPVYLSKPSIEEGEAPIKLGSGGNSVVALRLKKGKTYHLGRYNNEMNVGDTYMFSDQLNIKTPDDGIAYIGDIILDISAKGGDLIGGPGSSSVIGGRGSRVIDNESETVGELKQKYPALFQRFRYQKLLAQDAK